MGLRFVLVFLLSFFLLSPLVKTITRTIEKPLFIFVQDNSESIKINKDSLFLQNEYPEKVKQLIGDLEKKFEVVSYSFGEKTRNGLRFDYSEKLSDFSELFSELENRYANRNVGALLLASDGIYNKGINPLYAAQNFGFPIYTIALGDTSLQKDAYITRVKNNKITFLGNKFPLELTIKANELPNTSTKLQVFKNGKEVFAKEIQINSKQYSETIELELEATKKGLQRYLIKIQPITGELSTKNNFKNIVIDVLDSKQKVLILANSPHPDIGAIKQVLMQNPNLETDFFTVDKFKGDIKKYNLVLLHQIPSLRHTANLILKDLIKERIPILFILGTQSAVNQINELNLGLTIKKTRNDFDESNAVLNPNFTLFKLDGEAQNFIKSLPPLITPFGEYKSSITADVLFYQKVKNLKTDRPLFLFNQINGTKVGYITGEGIWRWRIYDYLENSNQEAFNQLINKVIQFLAIRISKDRFVVSSPKLLSENEAIVFDAEFYNKSYEPINQPEIELEITNSEDKKFSYLMDKVAKTYKLNAGVFPVGDYRFQARVKFNEKTFTRTGEFSVISIDKEAENPVADHHLLYQLAKENRGKILYANELDNILNEIEQNKDISPISYTEKNLQDLLNLKWLFFLILGLLSAEWFLRKYWGAY